MAYKKPLVVPYVPGLPSLPIYVADDRKIFQKHGLDPQLTNVGGDFGNAVRNVAEGKADLTFAAFFFVLETAVQIPDSLFVLQHNVDSKAIPTVYGLLVKEDSKIQEPKDLKAKNVAVFPAQPPNTQQGLFEAYVHSLADKVTALPLPKPSDPNLFAGIEALAKGDVEAVLTLEPIASLGALQIKGRLVGATPMGEVLVRIPTGAAVVNRKKYRNDPEFTRRVAAAPDEAVDHIRTNPHLMAEVYTNPKYGTLPKEAEELGHRFVLHYWKCSEIRGTEIQHAQEYADYLAKHGVLTASIDVDPLYFVCHDRCSRRRFAVPEWVRSLRVPPWLGHR